MHRDPSTSDETARLAVLRSLQILDTPDEPVFDALVRLAARALDAPIALVSLIDERRQWFKARVGLELQGTAREFSFCAHAIAGNAPVFAVADAQCDPRFRDNPLVTGEPHIRAYAGAVLKSAEGHALGTLCVIDRRPREFDADERGTLADLASLVQRELQRRAAEAALQALHQQLEARVAERTQALQHSHALLGRSEAALRASEEELRAVLANALDAYISLDADGVVIEWNGQAERTFGWSRDEAIGRPLDALIIPAAHRSAHRQGLRRMAAGAAPALLGRRLELPALTRSGETIPCEVTLNALDTPRGRVFFAFLHDVSERRHAQQALAEREQRLRLLADNIPALVAYIDRELRYVFVNEGYQQAFGVDAAGLIGKTGAALVEPETFAWLEPLVRRALAGERVSVEREVRANGRRLWCLINYVPDVDEAGRVRGLYSMTLDMSERRAAEQALRASEQRLRDITDHLPAVVAHFDADERCRFANPRAEHFPAFARRPAEGRALREVLGERYADYRPHFARVLAGERASFEGMLQARGTEVHFQAHLVPELGPDRNARGFYLLAYDQTELKQAERRSAAGEQRLRAVTDNLPVLIAFIDAQQRYEFCNATYREWLGVDPQALIGRTVRETLGDERYAPRAPYIERALAGERLEFVAEQRTLTGLRQLQTLYVPQCADDGRVQGVYALVHDVTEIKQAEQRMAELARSDALTGLPNRRCIEERLADALARARRSGAPMAVLFLDVDRFKTINDTLGHAVGDEVLREFAQRLKGALRETDAVGRLAGDEFVVVLENLKTEAQPQFVARKILAAIARPFELERGVLDVATSIGIAYLDDASLDGEAALKIADHALYQAKAGGRNTFRLGRR